MTALRERRWFWAPLVLSCVSIVAVVFAAWELMENRWFRTYDYPTLHYLYITRGIASSLVLAVWAGWFVLRLRRAAEADLRRSREHYRGLLESSPAAVALYDRELCIAEWNSSAERLYGYKKGEVLGRPLPTLSDRHRDEHARLMAHAKQSSGTTVKADTTRRAKDGTHIAVHLQLIRYGQDTREYFLELTQDIGDRVELQRKLIQVERLTSMGSMAAGTAHHLNTPLAALLLRTQLMRERCRQPACATDLAELETGMKFCQHFVRNLLDFARGAPLERQPQALVKVVQSAISFFSPALLARKTQLRLDLSPADGACVVADRNQLEAMVLILLSNAVDALPESGTIHITCSTAADSAVLEISDTGCGIPAADLEHVFEPFFTTKGQGKGTGLGMAIARKIVADHGGTIGLESRAGVGTRVCVRLPLSPHREYPEPA